MFLRQTVLILAFIAALSGCTGEPFTVTEARRVELVRTIVSSGRIVPPARVRLGSMLLGTVAEEDCEPGASVEAGQRLVGLEDAELHAAERSASLAFEQARERLAAVLAVDAPTALAGFDQARASLEKAEADDRRAAALVEAGVITPTEREASGRDLAVARAQHRSAELRLDDLSPQGGAPRLARLRVAEAEANLDAARARLAQTHITSPGAGIVLACLVEQGDIVQPGALLAEIAIGGATEVALAVDERNLPGLEVGRPAMVAADAFPDQTFPATVRWVSPLVDAARGTVDARLTIPEAPAFARIDMTVTAEVEVARDAEAMVIPLDALFSPEEDPHVFVLVDGRAERRGVRPGLRGSLPGQSSTEYWSITEGLTEGEQVLVPGEGGESPEEGARVRVGG